MPRPSPEFLQCDDQTVSTSLGYGSSTLHRGAFIFQELTGRDGPALDENEVTPSAGPAYRVRLMELSASPLGRSQLRAETCKYRSETAT